MRSLLIALALVAATFAYKEDMLNSNRIPEHTQEAFGNTCGECKSVVRSFITAIEDPTKLAELKLLLSALCHETSYEMECKMIVAKIDVIIKKLEPFLRDEETVCKKLHLCGNAKLTNFHRVGMLYLKSAMDRVDGKGAANDFVCDECQLAAIEFKKAIDDQNQRAAVKAFISEKVCKHIPKYSGACDLLLEEFLPEIWQSLDALLANPKVACAQIGFCAKQAGLPFNKQVTPKNTLSSFWKKSKHISTTSNDQLLVSCFECKVLIDALSYDLEEPEHFNAIADLLREWACPQIAENLRDGCEDFLKMYAPTVVYMTAAQLDAEGICTKVKCCDASSAMALRQMTKGEIESKKCDACKAFNAFLKYEITQPDFIPDLISAVNGHVCAYARDFSSLCENFSTTYIPLFVKRVTRLLETGAVCTKIAHVC